MYNGSGPDQMPCTSHIRMGNIAFVVSTICDLLHSSSCNPITNLCITCTTSCKHHPHEPCSVVFMRMIPCVIDTSSSTRERAGVPVRRYISREEGTRDMSYGLAFRTLFYCCLVGIHRLLLCFKHLACLVSIHAKPLEVSQSLHALLHFSFFLGILGCRPCCCVPCK